MVLSAALALATGLSRLALISSRPGEPDSARYLIGIGQWLAHGSRAVMIYDQALSVGYYRMGLAIAGWAGNPERTALALNLLSALAATATAPITYALGRRWLPRAEALAAALLWLFSPGLWWLGLEPHPQGPAIALGLLGLWAAARALESGSRARAAAWGLGGMCGFACSLLLKSDLLLLAPAFPALAIWHDRTLAPASFKREEHGQRNRNFRFGLACLLPVLAWLIALAARSAWLRGNLSGSAGTPGHLVEQFLSWPSGGVWLKQLLPVATGLGFGTWLVLVTGIGLALGRWLTVHNLKAKAANAANAANSESAAAGIRPRNWGSALMLVSWGAPGMGLWLLIAGNNTRHTILFTLPWVWAGFYAWRRAWPQAPVAGLACIALGLNWLAIPANSNMTLYPSPNVPRSAALLAHQLHRMHQLARAMPAQAARLQRLTDMRASARARSRWPVCYLGWYGNPYLEYDLLTAGMRLRRAGQALVLERQSAGIAFLHVRSRSDYARATEICRRSYSLEYGPGGLHYWFMGEEWRHMPFWRRWYPGGRAPVVARAVAPATGGAVAGGAE